MSFVADILTRRSVSVVGLAKNVGKTECLNYILRESAALGAHLGVTSIGIDGESIDQVSGTEKPEITLWPGTVFATSDKHYGSRRMVAEVLAVADRRTALGKLVVARALTEGKVLLSGPSDTRSLKEMLDLMPAYGVQTTLVDGALSRLSPASPTVTDAMVLVTGAAVSRSIPSLVKKTKYVYDLLNLPEAGPEEKRIMEGVGPGIWVPGEDGNPVNAGASFAFAGHMPAATPAGEAITVYAGGAVADRFLESLSGDSKMAAKTKLVVKDFTRIFAAGETFYAFLKKGGRIEVAARSDLLALCVNPVSPDGYSLEPETLYTAMEDTLGIPVYDVRRMER